MVINGHQPYSRGLYTHYKDSLLKGGMTISNIRSLDPGTYVEYALPTGKDLQFLRILIPIWRMGPQLVSG